MSGPERRFRLLPTLNEFFPGTALFFSTYYIVSVNPSILEGIGMPYSAVLFATLAVIIIGNLSGFLLTGTSLLIAPGIGMSVFTVAFVGASTAMTWQHAMLGTFLAGLAIALTSIRNGRSKIIRSIPAPIIMGVKGAIGALIAKGGIDIVAAAQGIPPVAAYLVTGLATGIILVFAYLRRFVLPTLDGHQRLFQAVGYLDIFLSVLFATLALHLLFPAHIATLAGSEQLDFLWACAGATDFTLPFDALAQIAILGAVIWFLVVTDIPGTPDAVLPPAYRKEKFKRRVVNGYRNDAFFAVLSPLFGTTSTIYYAENMVLKSYDGAVPDQAHYGWRTGFVTVCYYTLLLAFIAASASFDWGIGFREIVPPLAIAHVLIFVGLFIIAHSFLDEEQERARVTEKGVPVATRSADYYLPAAIGIILAPTIGLEMALPLSIIAYWVLGGLRIAPLDAEELLRFTPISIGAIAVLIVNLCLMVYEGGVSAAPIVSCGG